MWTAERNGEVSLYKNFVCNTEWNFAKKVIQCFVKNRYNGEKNLFYQSDYNSKGLVTEKTFLWRF